MIEELIERINNSINIVDVIALYNGLYKVIIIENDSMFIGDKNTTQVYLQALANYLNK